MKYRTDEELRLSIQIHSEPIPEAGCWIWTKSVDKDGYGKACYRNTSIPAHRLSWMLFRGPLRAGYVLMHRCDVPACVNPSHLREGTSQENTADKMMKGRHRTASGPNHYLKRNPHARSGDKSSRSKVSEAQAIEIRRRFSAGEKQKDLATEFGITRSAISGIVTRRTFNHL